MATAKINYAELDTLTLLKTLHESQTKRRAEAKVLAVMEEREKSIQQELVKRKLTSGIIDGYAVVVDKEEVPNPESWPEILEYIKSTGEVDLLEKRLLKSGVKARWENGVTIPGIGKSEKTTLKVEAL